MYSAKQHNLLLLLDLEEAAPFGELLLVVSPRGIDVRLRERARGLIVEGDSELNLSRINCKTYTVQSYLESLFYFTGLSG